MKKQKLNSKIFLSAAEIMDVSYHPFACTSILEAQDSADDSEELIFFKENFSPKKGHHEYWDTFWGSPTNNNTSCRVIALLLCYEMTK